MRAMNYYRGKNLVITIANVSDFIRGKVQGVEEIIIGDDSITVRFAFLKSLVRGGLKLEYIGYAEGSLVLIRENS